MAAGESLMSGIIKVHPKQVQYGVSQLEETIHRIPQVIQIHILVKQMFLLALLSVGQVEILMAMMLHMTYILVQVIPLRRL